MKNLKSATLVIICVIHSLGVQAQYVLTDADVVVTDGVITDYTGSETNIVIPNILDGQEITAIGYSAFYARRLTAVDFSRLINLTSIGTFAFHENYLKTVDLSGLTSITTIGRSAFYINQITTVDLSGLTNLDIIDDYAFGRNRLTAFDFSNLTNLTTIGISAFAYNSLTTVDLSDLVHVKIIKLSAFANNSLTSFALPLTEGYIYKWQNSAFEVFSNGDTVDDLETSYRAEFQDFSVYAITYNSNGGSHANSQTYTVEDAVTFTTATKTGYNFEGWFAEKDFTTEITEVTAGTTGNLALFAKYTLLDYAITYHSDGGLHDNTTTTFTVEDALTIRAATKAGYIFEGWFTDENFTTEITEITAGTTGDLALFAKYSEVVLGLIERDALVLYPNPVTHSFSINQPIDQVNVLNLGGQVVHTFCENQIRFDVSHLASGHYIVQLIQAGKSLGTKKIIIEPSAP